MKKKFKISTSILACVLLLSLVFGACVYASQWLNFTGDNKIEQSENDVDEIMQILRDVNSDKLTAEQALAELQDLNPAGLAKQNKEMREQIEQLKTNIGVIETELAYQQQLVQDKQSEIDEKNTAYDLLQQERDRLQAELDNYNGYVEHLEAELTRANEKSQSVSNKTTEAVEEARTYK